jgi:hypothetical protein
MALSLSLSLFLRRAFDGLYSCFVKRNHVSILNRIQGYKPRKLSSRKRKVDEMFVVDETMLNQVARWHGSDGWQLMCLPTRKFSQKHIQGKKHVCGDRASLVPC